jgi:hypothetical protein
MSGTSDSLEIRPKACLSVDLIEGLFTNFAQRRFVKSSRICLPIFPPVTSELDDHWCGWCGRSGFREDPLQYYSFTGGCRSSPRGDTLDPVDAHRDSVVGHRLCMTYNTDPDGAASRMSDSKQIHPPPPSVSHYLPIITEASGALLWTDANGKYNVTELKPSLDWTKRKCAIGGGRYNQKTAKSFVSIPSTRGFGSRETACEPCAVSLKRFAGKSYYLGCKVGSWRKRCFMKRVPMPPSSENQMGTTMRLYVVQEHFPSIITTSTSGSRGLNICMTRLTRRLGQDRVLYPTAN